MSERPECVWHLWITLMTETTCICTICDLCIKLIRFIFQILKPFYAFYLKFLFFQFWSPHKDNEKKSSPWSLSMCLQSVSLAGTMQLLQSIDPQKIFFRRGMAFKSNKEYFSQWTVMPFCLFWTCIVENESLHRAKGCTPRQLHSGKVDFYASHSRLKRSQWESGYKITVKAQVRTEDQRVFQ